MKKSVKTNVMRIVDQAGLPYQTFTYEHDDEAVDGCRVAMLLHTDPKQVFKTLVTQANTREYLVFLVPVAQELDLKKGAKAAGVKSIEMLHVKDLNRLTGYIRGGCSPIGMKKQFRTFLDESCLNYDMIMFSAGKIGTQIAMDPKDLLNLISAQTAKLIKES